MDDELSSIRPHRIKWDILYVTPGIDYSEVVGFYLQSYHCLANYVSGTSLASCFISFVSFIVLLSHLSLDSPIG